MFAARLVAVTFSGFVLVYGGLSLAVSCGWRKFWLYSQRDSARHGADLLADLLFGLRLFPLLAAVAVTLAFTVPSFLLLEPRSIDEPIGMVPLLLGSCGLLLAAFGAWNAVRAAKTASRAITAWTNESKLVESRGKIPVVRIARVVPALAAAGILKPRILMSGAAEFLLTEKELQTAVRHELAHVRRRDNLKKLLLRLVELPGMAGLEAAWLEATELAADDAAVFNAREALDLAAALIKLSRLAPAEAQVDLMAPLVHSPVAMMNVRVERLIAWNEERRVPARRGYSSWCGAGCAAGVALVLVAGFVPTYSALLVRVHTVTEWLVR
jgi:beta-lactamase regulating signal transducer with metallopeptidase domain